MNPGIWQIAIVAILLIVLFGRGKISGIMADVAQGIKGFKKGMAEEEKPVEDDTPKALSKETEETVSPPKKDKANH